MYKNLVKRSRIQKITITKNSPIDLLIEGDEVNVWARPVEGFFAPDQVHVARQSDREAAKFAVEGVADQMTTGYAILDVGAYKAPLSGIAPYNSIGSINPVNGDYGVNLLCGFSDHVQMSVVTDQPLAAINVFIESITYEPRR